MSNILTILDCFINYDTYLSLSFFKRHSHQDYTSLSLRLKDRAEQRIQNIINELEDLSINPLYIKGNQYTIGEQDFPSQLKNPLSTAINMNHYYLYDFCGHSGYWTINELKTIEEVEDILLGDSGVTNMFSTALYVYYKGSIREYKVLLRSSNQEVDLTNLIQTTELHKEDIYIAWT